MSEIELSPAQRDLLRDRLSKYCEETFNLELEQFDAEFFVDFIAQSWGRCSTTPVSKRPSAPIWHGASGSRRDGFKEGLLTPRADAGDQ